MKYMGVVTDRSWLDSKKAEAFENLSGEPMGTLLMLGGKYYYPDRPRIYSDEVPMADKSQYWAVRIANKARKKCGILRGVFQREAMW